MAVKIATEEIANSTYGWTALTGGKRCLTDERYVAAGGTAVYGGSKRLLALDKVIAYEKPVTTASATVSGTLTATQTYNSTYQVKVTGTITASLSNPLSNSVTLTVPVTLRDSSGNSLGTASAPITVSAGSTTGSLTVNQTVAPSTWVGSVETGNVTYDATYISSVSKSITTGISAISNSVSGTLTPTVGASSTAITGTLTFAHKTKEAGTITFGITVKDSSGSTIKSTTSTVNYTANATSLTVNTSTTSISLADIDVEDSVASIDSITVTSSKTSSETMTSSITGGTTYPSVIVGTINWIGTYDTSKSYYTTMQWQLMRNGSTYTTPVDIEFTFNTVQSHTIGQKIKAGYSTVVNTYDGTTSTVSDGGNTALDSTVYTTTSSTTGIYNINTVKTISGSTKYVFSQGSITVNQTTSKPQITLNGELVINKTTSKVYVRNATWSSNTAISEDWLMVIVLGLYDSNGSSVYSKGVGTSSITANTLSGDLEWDLSDFDGRVENAVSSNILNIDIPDAAKTKTLYASVPFVNNLTTTVIESELTLTFKPMFMVNTSTGSITMSSSINGTFTGVLKDGSTFDATDLYIGAKISARDSDGNIIDTVSVIAAATAVGLTDLDGNLISLGGSSSGAYTVSWILTKLASSVANTTSGVNKLTIDSAWVRTGAGVLGTTVYSADQVQVVDNSTTGVFSGSTTTQDVYLGLNYTNGSTVITVSNLTNAAYGAQPAGGSNTGSIQIARLPFDNLSFSGAFSVGVSGNSSPYYSPSSYSNVYYNSTASLDTGSSNAGTLTHGGASTSINTFFWRVSSITYNGTTHTSDFSLTDEDTNIKYKFHLTGSGTWWTKTL